MGEHVHEDFRRVRPPLEGTLVRLRATEEADLPRIHDLFNDPDVLLFLQSVIFPEPLAGKIRSAWILLTSPAQMPIALIG